MPGQPRPHQPGQHQVRRAGPRVRGPAGGEGGQAGPGEEDRVGGELEQGGQVMRLQEGVTR